jgi:hypothetical protein
LLPGTVLHLEMVGHGDDEDDRTWLSYYATDEDRARWKEEFPDEELPPKKEAPFKRSLPEPFREEGDAS